LLSEVAEQSFPEMLGANYFIKTPWIFSKCFAVVKPFLDADTISKFVISSDSPIALFEKVLPRSMIPKEYGGVSDVSQCRCTLRQ
jgi:hypothetical protein